MGSVDKVEQVQVTNKVIQVIKEGKWEIEYAIDSIPQNRLPSKKIKKSIQELREKVELELRAAEIDPLSVKEYADIDELEVLSRRITLQRYALLISKDKNVTPYATFYELHKAYNGTPKSGLEEVKTAYTMAVRALFTHPEMANALIVRLGKNSQILGEEGDRTTNSLRNRIELFLEHYEENRKQNLTLAKNEAVNDVIIELEAIVFLQQQASELAAGTKYASEELIDFINTWANFLSGLSAEEQMKRTTLIEAVERCSALHNEMIEASEGEG